ncbi:class I SAM-dependent methyltransferase [Micromonospora fulviviridis]|uniref:Class I SAM-dependent methyltransferase n=1 Tax=Micromonospora fulviviridis TaxID=47860 RepID=A0ABV2VTJ9_9ACTN
MSTESPSSTKGRQFDELLDFYRPQRDGEPNLFQIWEEGGSREDSVTPSTYSSRYRTWMCDKLVRHLRDTGETGILSLGCGNAAVEAELVRAGHRVVAIDAMAEAVELARAKGVEAIQADLTDWVPSEPWSLIYMDGVLGHLYTPEVGLGPILRRIRSWLVPGPTGVATFVASNDDTRDGSPAQPAPKVRGFHWLATGYIGEQALAAGFDSVEIEHFSYQRPLSGDRRRSVIAAHVRP